MFGVQSHLALLVFFLTGTESSLRSLAIAISNLRFFIRRFRGRLGRQKPIPQHMPTLNTRNRTYNMKTALGSLVALDVVMASIL